MTNNLQQRHNIENQVLFEGTPSNLGCYPAYGRIIWPCNAQLHDNSALWLAQTPASSDPITNGWQQIHNEGCIKLSVPLRCSHHPYVIKQRPFALLDPETSDCNQSDTGFQRLYYSEVPPLVLSWSIRSHLHNYSVISSRRLIVTLAITGDP